MNLNALKVFLIAGLLLANQSLWADESFCQSASKTINRTADEFWQYGSYSDKGFDEAHYANAYANFDNTIKPLLTDTRSLACDWQDLESVKVATSPDKKLRSFSWDLATGGTLHEFAGVIQTQDNQGNIVLTNTLPKDNEVGLVSAIHQMTLKNQSSPVYVINQYMIGSTALHMEQLNLYQLNNGILQPANLIQTSQLSDSLSFTYNDFSTPKAWKDKKLIQVDNQKHQISIPVILDKTNDGMGEVTEKRIVYQYNGKVFKRVKN